MRINYFQAGGSSTPYRTLFPDLPYNPLDETASALYQNGIKTERATLPKEPKLSEEEVARLIVRGQGKWAVTGKERRALLEKEGYDYNRVQAIVNKLMKEEQTKQGNKSNEKSSENIEQSSNNSLNRSEEILEESLNLSHKSLDLAIAAINKLEQNKFNRGLSSLFSGISSGVTTENQYPAMLLTEQQNNIIRLNADIINRRQNPLLYYSAFKRGGQINYFQQGGQMQQDPVEQVIQGSLQVEQVIQGLLQDPQGTMQALSQMQGQQGGKERVNAILQEIVKRAKGGDQQAAQAVQVLQQAMQGGQQLAQMAEKGAKLNYLRKLKGLCADDEELTYMKKGGVVCPVCQKKKEASEKGNKKLYFGKDKKVAKAQEGTDTAKISKKVTAKGDTITTEKYPNRLIQTFSPSGIVRDSTASGISIYNPNLMPAGGMLVSPADSIKYENILKQPARPIYKLGGKTQFFKQRKQLKAPLAKCGKKMKK